MSATGHPVNLGGDEIGQTQWVRSREARRLLQVTSKNRAFFIKIMSLEERTAQNLGPMGKTGTHSFPSIARHWGA